MNVKISNERTANKCHYWCDLKIVVGEVVFLAATIFKTSTKHHDTSFAPFGDTCHGGAARDVQVRRDQQRTDGQ